MRPLHISTHRTKEEQAGLSSCRLPHGRRNKEVIARQLPVTTEFITQEEAQGRFDLERLPDGASETVRVVKVGDYDECLCIGVHVENTSEIGTFKIISHDWDEEAKRWRMRFKLV